MQLQYCVDVACNTAHNVDVQPQITWDFTSRFFCSKAKSAVFNKQSSQSFPPTNICHPLICGVYKSSSIISLKSMEMIQCAPKLFTRISRIYHIPLEGKLLHSLSILYLLPSLLFSVYIMVTYNVLEKSGDHSACPQYMFCSFFGSRIILFWSELCIVLEPCWVGLALTMISCNNESKRVTAKIQFICIGTTSSVCVGRY